MTQAPCFNFELDEDQLLDKALEVGFVTKVDEDLYEVNDNYKSSGGWSDRWHYHLLRFNGFKTFF